MSRRRLVSLVVLGALVLAAAAGLVGALVANDGGGTGTGAAATTTAPTTAPTTTEPGEAPSAPAPTTTEATGCPPGRALPPADGEVLGTVDADGDGRPEVFLAVAPDAAGHVHIEVAHAADCRLTVVRDAAGHPYRFVVQAGDGGLDGLGCVDADGDGRRDIVGLHGEAHAGGVDWTRSIVRLNGDRATNGPVDEGNYRSGDPRVDLLGQATCGDVALYPAP